MTTTQNFLAFDLGAESGRALLGKFDGEQVTLHDLHRFANGPVRLASGLHWDVLRLWGEIKQGIALANQQTGGNVRSLGVDAWGVDFGLLDRHDVLIGNPYHYRDSRTDGMVELACERVARADIFMQTGIQFMQLNSLYQLLSMAAKQSPALASAQTFLTIPDLFNFWLTGRKVCEFSNATTTQAYDPRQRYWAFKLLQRLGIPTHIFPEVVYPGAMLGELLPSLASEVGAVGQVIAPACHDTGSAVAAVPASGERFAWISSGTWSIIGAEVKEAVINQESLDFNFTNEGGVNGTYRFSKNVAGLWLVQECRRTWARQGQDYSYSDLAALASQAKPFQSVIDPDHALYLKPSAPGDDMPTRIRARCQATGEAVPADNGALIRAILESLALKYRWVIEKLELMLGYRLDPIHIVGGGTQNQLLCQLTADATGRPVVAGPVEATALGNLIVQMMAVGAVGSHAQGREVLRHSFALTTYEPAVDRSGWDEAYARLLNVMRNE